MPIRYPRRAGLLLATGQTTQYSSELDDGYYKKGLVKRYDVLTLGQYSSTVNVDLTHLVSSTGAFTFADQTYTDAGKCGVFKAAGGETIVITGSASNNGTFTTVSATADTVVVSSGFVNEADAPETTFKKREAMSNNCVLDNNTGLMWARYVESKMGVLGTGLMPWTGQTYDIFAFCAAANTASLGGYTDWRVANLFELINLSDFEIASTHAPNTTTFPSWPVTTYFWSSTTRKTSTTMACFIGYGSSFYVSVDTKTTEYYCALVRG